MGTAVVTPVVETEVTEKAKRRRFTAEYKREILKQAAACTERGELGALLRREGLYSSHLTEWRAAVSGAGSRHSSQRSVVQFPRRWILATGKSPILNARSHE